jgi:Leucine-rich repeat (LRR) protein
MSQLTKLILQNNQISSIQRETFDDLVALQTLDLSDNSLAHIDQNHFKRLSSLVHLNLSKNVLIRLEQGSYRFLNQLKELNLGFNSLFKVSVNTLFSNESMILLENLNLQSNVINELDMNSFAGLEKLAELNLNDNDFKMKVIEKKTNSVIILPNLTYLKVRNAPIQLIGQFNLSNILEIDFTNSQLSHSVIQSLPFETIRIIQLAGISKIITLNFSFWNNFGQNLSHIDLSFNKIGNLSVLFSKISYPHNIKDLVLRSTSLNDSFFTLINLYFYSSISRLDLSSNKITAVPYLFFANAPKLVYLNLSRNCIKQFHEWLLGWNNDLKFLDLSYNTIEEIKATSFRCIPKIVFLDLSHNRLKYLEQQAFGSNHLSSISNFLINDNLFLSRCDVYLDSSKISLINGCRA